MAAYNTQCSFTLRDARGRAGVVRLVYHVGADSSPGTYDAAGAVQTMASLISAASNAAVTRYSGPGGKILNPDVYGVAAAYQAIEQKARLVFSQTAGGVEFPQLSLSIPAPITGIFYADGITVDPTVTEIANLLTAIYAVDGTGGYWTNRSGAPVQAGGFIGGMFRAAPLQRRITIWDLSANLDEREG
jgi:hypothetical protein